MDIFWGKKIPREDSDNQRVSNSKPKNNLNTLPKPDTSMGFKR